MARWDEILTLPVQNPPSPEFSSTDIVWSRVEGWKEMMDRVALIPFSRVNDFVRGESNRKECPTKFHVEARRRRPPEMPYKPKVDGILEYILYWCSFGPDDHRKGGVVRPSRNYTAKRKTPAGRPNTKRGCTCHFIVKRLIAEPTVALIIYNHEKHVDKQGSPCHGPLDKKAAGTHAMFAPYISEELRLQVMSLIYVGVPVETIMQRHAETVDNQGGPRNRDDLLTHRYVRRLERKIRRSTYELDTDDSISLNMWIENHQAHVFFYEDYSDSEPFVLGIQTEWQLQQMIRFGNRSLVASDSRFGTNKLKYPVHSLLVFDSNNNAIPVAWIITPRFANSEMHRWLRPLYDRVHSKDPNWKLGGFIIDNPLADVLTIREVFQCSVLICYWRMRHAWHKNIMKRCSEAEMSAEMFRQLGKVVSIICRGGDMDLFEGFLGDFVDCSDFLDYFKAVWFPRLGLWIAALKTLPVSTAETCAAIECYHHQLKLRLLNEKDMSVYQRADWLVDKLGTKVHSYYWLDEFTGKASFARYWKDEWKSGLTSWRQALQIADSNVIIDGNCARVNSQKNRDKVHIVWNPGSEFSVCDCGSSRMGNLCKHAIKAGILYRKRRLATPSTSLVRYNQILSSILYCPPHDSLIRDHAVALAISAKMQLHNLFDQENGSAAPSVLARNQEQTGGSVPASDVAENRHRSFTDVAGQTVTTGMAFASEQTEQVCHSEQVPLETEAQPGTVPLETEALNSNSVAMECTEDGEGILLDEGVGSAVNTSKTSVVGDDSQGGLDATQGGEDSRSSETGKGFSEGTVTSGRTITEPEPVQSQLVTIKSNICNDASASECASQTSKVLDNGKILCDVAESCSSDPMDIDCTGRNTDVCHIIASQAADNGNNSENVPDNPDMDLMMNGISTESGICELVINGSDQGKVEPMEAVPVGHDCCNGVGDITEIDGCHNDEGKENVGKRPLNGQGMDFRSSPPVAEGSAQNPLCASEVPADKRMHVLLTRECGIDNWTENPADVISNGAPATDGVNIKPPEEACSSALSVPVTGLRVDLNAAQEADSDEGKAMEVEIVPCAEPAEGASAGSLKT